MAKRPYQASLVNKETGPHSSMNKVKLCGYLKKKRNVRPITFASPNVFLTEAVHKVGGWRKLWFVLHDRLLVSYASKEEYDNKLTSFKDILNLVPGTQVRLIDGFRFTIETTTQVVYTFHCDDHMAYREWIAMLLDSAGSTLNCSRKFHYFSAHDPMQGAQTKTKSCDLVIGAEHNVLRKYMNDEKDIFNQITGNFKNSREDIRKPSSILERIESQTLKKQLERMNISGTEDYRYMAFTSGIKEYNSSKMVISQTTERSINEPLQLACKIEQSPEIYKTGEPVYAIVDLKNKYDQRKKRSELMEEKRSTSYESIYRIERDKVNDKEKSLESLVDVVYEDGDVFFNRNISDCGLLEKSSSEPCEIEENIYEPINVGPKTSMFEFRKYIGRLKLNPFLRTTSTRKLKTNCLDTKIPSPNGTMSRFSTLRRKLGKHLVLGKSVQRRMRKLYSNVEPNPLFQYHSEDISASFCVDNDKIIKTSKLSNECARFSNETKKHSNDDANRKQTTINTQKFDSLSPVKKEVTKITKFNSSSVKNVDQ